MEWRCFCKVWTLVVGSLSCSDHCCRLCEHTPPCWGKLERIAQRRIWSNKQGKGSGMEGLVEINQLKLMKCWVIWTSRVVEWDSTPLIREPYMVSCASCWVRHSVWDRISYRSKSMISNEHDYQVLLKPRATTWKCLLVWELVPQKSQLEETLERNTTKYWN